MTYHVRSVDLECSAAGTGRTLVWGHGMTSSRAHEDEVGFFRWDELTDLVRVVRYDARGHGGSAATYEPADFEWNNLALDMLGVADAVHAECFVAGGASMGAATALYAALAAPERIDALVLAVPPTAWETRAERAAFIRATGDMVQRVGLEAVAELERVQPPIAIFAQDYPEIVRIDSRHFARMDERACVALFAGAARSDFPPRERIARLTMPTLILAWAGDPGHPVATAESLAAVLPAARLEVAETVAAIRTWTERIREFVAALPPVRQA